MSRPELLASINEFAWVGLPHECWPARDYKTAKYSQNSRGVRYRKYKGHPVHSLAYLLAHGSLLGVTDHLCRRPDCCNPAHMEDVGHGENAGRSGNLARDELFCPKGHPRTEENTYRHPRRNHIKCRECRAEGMRNRASRMV